MKSNLIYTVILVATILFVGCKKKQVDEASDSDTYCIDSKTKKIIETLTVQKQEVVEKIHLTGNIQINPNNIVHFNSLLDGMISNTYFSLGDEVVKGQILAEMKSAELNSLQAELHSINAKIEIAKIDLDAKKQMFNDGILANKDLIESQNQLNILQSEREKVKNILSLYSADNSKNVFQIKAPISGFVTHKNINPGTTVTDNELPLFSISNLNNIWVMANIYATDIAYINEGMEVNINTLSYPDMIFEGHIDAVSHVLDQNTKVLQARMEIENKDYKLKPGMNADVIVQKKINKQEVAIPTASIVFSNNKNYVLVYHQDCDIEIREVVITIKTNKVSYVQKGLSEGETIITKNQLLVFEELK